MSDSPIKVKCGGGDMRLSSCGTAVLPSCGAAKRWPSVGRSNGRPWGDPVDATSGENQWPPVGRSDGRRHRGSNVGRRGRRASVARCDCQRTVLRTAGAAVRRVCLELACCGLAKSCWPRISSGPYFGDRCPDVWLTSVPLLERPPCKPSLRPTVLRSPSSTLATDLDDGGHFRGAIFEGSVFTGHSRSKLAPERSWPAAELAISAAARSWRIGRSFKEGGQQHPMIFRRVGFAVFCVRGAGKRGRGPSLRQKPVGRRAGQSGEARVGRASSDWLFRSERPRCSRAKPGKPTGRKISGGGATNVTDLAKLLWGRGRRRHIVGVFGKAAFGGWIYRRGMRGGGMVAGTRSWRGSRSCFEGRHVEVGAVSRGRSCFG